MRGHSRPSGLIAVCSALALSIASAGVLAEVTFDGVINIGPEWAVPQTPVLQDNYTGFGDQVKGEFGGSELDELYAYTDGTYLYVGVSGNLQQNGNAVLLLLDVKPGGQNVLKTEIAPVVTELPCSGNGPPYTLQNLGQALTTDTGTGQTIRDATSTGTKLDAGFEPDYAFAVDTFGGNLHVTQYTLSDTALGQWDNPDTNDGSSCGPPIEALDYFTTRLYLGQAVVNTGVLTTASGSQFAYNNTGYLGVTGTAVLPAGTAPTGTPAGDPRSQTTGLEARIALQDLGFTELPLVGTLSVKIAVLLASSDGIVSNQVLPGVGHGTSAVNLNNRPDFTGITTGGVGGDGSQFASLNLAPTGFAPAIDGQGIVADFAGALVASQDTVTGFGNHPQNPDINRGGSEIDQLVAQATTTSIDIGITGNLEGNGNRLVIFLDTKDGGESLLDANAGGIAGMNTDTVPLLADYALVLNTGGGGNNIWVDLVDLQANTTAFLGSDEVDTGNGAGNGILSLNGVDNVPDWRVRFNNTNEVGVNDRAADDPAVQKANAATATTGWEISIPLSAVGSPMNREVCLFALIGGQGNGNYLSNQLLPAGLGGTRANFATPPDDLAAAGYHCFPLVIGTLGPICNDPRFDADGDSDVDQEDFGVFQACYTGSGAPVVGDCRCFDWNRTASDGHIDKADLDVFLRCAATSGPTIPADKTCDDPPPQQ